MIQILALPQKRPDIRLQFFCVGKQERVDAQRGGGLDVGLQVVGKEGVAWLAFFGVQNQFPKKRIGLFGAHKLRRVCLVKECVVAARHVV